MYILPLTSRKDLLMNITKQYVSETYPNICQIIASKDGQIYYEDTWNGYTPNDNVHVASVTKSIISLLIGIAIDQGLIANTDVKILDFFPNYTCKRGEKTIQQVTLKHLLTMTAPYKYKSEPWTKVCTTNDWTNAVLDLLGGRKGLNGEFMYSTLGIQLLSAIITNVSNMPTYEFANKYLFSPLGIAPRKELQVANKDEHISFITSKTPKEASWFCDPNSIAAAGFGLCLSARDMLRIGELVLNHGCYGGQQIVTSDWILQMLSPNISCDEKFNHMQYGYLWWIIDSENKIYAAIGDGGNIIYINKSNNIVVSIASTFKPLVFDRVEFIQKYIDTNH